MRHKNGPIDARAEILAAAAQGDAALVASLLASETFSQPDLSSALLESAKHGRPECAALLIEPCSLSNALPAQIKIATRSGNAALASLLSSLKDKQALSAAIPSLKAAGPSRL